MEETYAATMSVRFVSDMFTVTGSLSKEGLWVAGQLRCFDINWRAYLSSEVLMLYVKEKRKLHLRCYDVCLVCF